MAGCAPRSGATPVGKLRPLPKKLAKRLFGEKLGTSEKWATFGTHGDGSCLYHSIAAAVSRLDPSEKRRYTELSAREQKDLVHRWRCSMQDSYTEAQHAKLSRSMRSSSPPKDEVRRKLCLSHEWADEIMIRHAADLLDVNLMFVDCMNGHMYCNVHGSHPEDQPTIVIAWIQHKHFEPIVRVTGKSTDGKKGRFRGVLLPQTNADDAEALRALLNSYYFQCAI